MQNNEIIRKVEATGDFDFKKLENGILFFWSKKFENTYQIITNVNEIQLDNWLKGIYQPILN